ncbi:MAG: hypothetical protein KOO60_03505 [Gemmatimonadales bacterium]|nr:hypothetical protein [Gemmatimonadales bacterium]
MELRDFGEISLTRAATATLVLVLLSILGGVPAEAADSSVENPGSEMVGTGITEPLFAFLLALASGDSLGLWTGEDITQFAADSGRRSKFPLDQFVSVERRRPLASESSLWPDGYLVAKWELKLIGDLDRPMPYSILGYHPGSLRISDTLVLSELNLGDRTFIVPGKEEPQPRHFDAIKALRVDVGSVVLDADAIPDALLRGNLDDAWTLGFVLTREGNRQVGLAVSVKRDGGAIFGELDFTTEKILKSGSPLGGQLSRFCRGWFTRPGSMPPAPWIDSEHTKPH